MTIREVDASELGSVETVPPELIAAIPDIADEEEAASSQEGAESEPEQDDGMDQPAGLPPAMPAGAAVLVEVHRFDRCVGCSVVVAGRDMRF